VRTRGRHTTYVAPEYKDTRDHSRKLTLRLRGGKINQKFKKARCTNNYNNETFSTADYTKRKVRKEHFPNEDIEDLDTNIQQTQNCWINPGSSKHRFCGIQKEIGYWCPNCFQLMLQDGEVENHIKI